MIEIETKAQFDTLLSMEDIEFILLFYAPFAPPSLLLKEELENYDDKPIYSCNIVDFPEQAKIFNLAGVPMLIWLVNGNINKWQVGYIPEGGTLNGLFE